MPIYCTIEVLPPVAVEVQNTVDKTLIHRIMEYCNREKYHAEPIALTICVNKVRKCVSDLFADTAKAPFLRKLPSECWAQQHLFMNKHTISAFFEDAAIRYGCTRIVTQVVRVYFLPGIFLFGLQRQLVANQ